MRSTKWIGLTVGLLAAGFFVWVETGASVDIHSQPFGSVQKRLIADGFEPMRIKQLYSRPQVGFEADGVILLFTYKEAQVNYGQFTNKWSIRKANQYLQENKTDLTRIEKEYGVDKKVITAILLVETGLGASVGTRSTLNTLSTMAALKDPVIREKLWDLIPDSKKISRKKYEKKAASRSSWAYKELKAFLEYTSREGFDPAAIPGSFAGAVGIASLCPPVFWLTAKTATMTEWWTCSITPTRWPASPTFSRAMAGVPNRPAKKPRKSSIITTTAPIT